MASGRKATDRFCDIHIERERFFFSYSMDYTRFSIFVTKHVPVFGNVIYRSNIVNIIIYCNILCILTSFLLKNACILL